MLTGEFNLEFDILYNNIMSNAAPGLNSYEKSVFLTLAQEQLLKQYFRKAGNKYGEGVDDSEKRRLDFSMITKVSTPVRLFGDGINQDSRLYECPDDLMFVINEVIYTTPTQGISTEIQIIPINANEYTRLMTKPYARPRKKTAWRLSFEPSSFGDRLTEIVINPSDDVIDLTYKVKYIRRPNPIILEDLSPYNVSINNRTSKTECELSEDLHREILVRAVALACASYTNDKLQPMAEIGLIAE